MNSDFQEVMAVWRRQSTPPPLRSTDAVLRDVYDAERRWNAEWTAADRGYGWMVGLTVLLVGIDLLRGHGIDWPSASLGAIWIWWIILARWFQKQRRRLDRAGDVPLTDQFAKLRTLIECRRRTNRLQLLGLPLLGVAIGAMVWSASGHASAAIACGIGSLLALRWLTHFQQRKIDAHFADRLATIEQLAREIDLAP
ncbi:MAG TPA: hypothetical protein VHE61_21585 [Opitutaceae bacterium]|nr:hypothetical protein [Opitutaceae bacterium]